MRLPTTALQARSAQAAMQVDCRCEKGGRGVRQSGSKIHNTAHNNIRWDGSARWGGVGADRSESKCWLSRVWHWKWQRLLLSDITSCKESGGPILKNCITAHSSAAILMCTDTADGRYEQSTTVVAMVTVRLCGAPLNKPGGTALSAGKK